MEFLRYSSTVARGEKTRKEFARLLQRYRAAVTIQKQIKSKRSRKRFEDIHGASIMLQAGTIFVFAHYDLWFAKIWVASRNYKSIRSFQSSFTLLKTCFQLFVAGWLGDAQGTLHYFNLVPER